MAMLRCRDCGWDAHDEQWDTNGGSCPVCWGVEAINLGAWENGEWSNDPDNAVTEPGTMAAESSSTWGV